MKKIKYLFMFLLILIETGCVKFNTNMDINMDKSMDYSIILAFDKSVIKTDDEILTKEQINMMKQNGFNVSNYSVDNMDGYVLTKKIQNIDEVSSDNDSIYDLSGMFNGKNEDKYMFKMEKGLFRNTYKSVIKINPKDSGIDFDNENYNTEIKPDLRFNVKLPYGSISNNATKINNKELVWNLSTKDISNIEFEFYMYNLEIILIIFGVISVIIALIIILISKKKSKKKEEIIKNDTTIEIKDEIDDDIISEPILKKKAAIMEEKEGV